ncbi:MAG TPA: glycosyltransferase family 4 protein [Chthonomonadaceae bacterium]|nr:glycosyltransferase family 4 protein [Chthonomonadaceae bacterium]
MKILQVASSLFGSGGIEKSVLHLAGGLRERGHEVHVAAWRDTWVWRQAQAQGFETVLLRVRKQQDWAALGPYARLLRRGGYDIVNTHFSPDYIVPAVAARLVRQRGCVLTRYFVGPWRGFKRRLYGGMLYPKIIAVSDAVRCALLSGGLAESQVATVYGGVPVRAQAVAPAPLREELGLPADSVLIGIVARLAPEKGHRFLLEAMRDVAPDAVCLVAGQGPEEAALRAYVAANGLADRVRFLGWRLDSDAIIAALDIVVQPSLWEEACSLSIMEAMSLGKPLVATHSGGNAELIAQEESGLLVAKGDVPALAEALNRLARDPGLCGRMGEAGRQRQAERFSVEAMAADTERIYLETLESCPH